MSNGGQRVVPRRILEKEKISTFLGKSVKMEGGRGEKGEFGVISRGNVEIWNVLTRQLNII